MKALVYAGPGAIEYRDHPMPTLDADTDRIPDGLSDEQVLFLTDILATGYEVGVLKGQVRPGDTVVIVGAGPVGLSAALTAQLFSPRNVIVVDRVADSDEIAHLPEEMGDSRWCECSQAASFSPLAAADELSSPPVAPVLPVVPA